MIETRQRVLLFYALLGFGFLVLLGRLFQLQVILGSENRQKAEGNRIRKIINPAPRGIVFDRNDQPLVRNVPLYRLQEPDCHPEPGNDCFKPISREEALMIEAEAGEALDRLRIDVGRDYLYGSALAHVLGYLGEVNEEEIESSPVYKLGDLIGRIGIEQQYDDRLRGVDGGEIFEVNTRGNKTREMGVSQPIPGEDLYLSIDPKLSQVALEALGGQKGAVVVTEAQTGQVIVLVSSPAFDPEKITSEILTDEEEPMFNRAISGAYPPGSTFKIVTATAGIEEGKVSRETTYEDKGFIKIGEYIYNNWLFTKRGQAEGVIDVVYALKRSTDTFFYKVGEWVGAKQLSAWARAFGLGKKTEVDIFGEVSGLVPDPDWKLKTAGERWFLGNTYHFSIGQADLLTTPLQINLMTSIITNQGKLCQPRIIKKEKPNCQNLKLKKETLELIKEGLEQACATGGTAWPLFDFEPKSACKTGTAEFGPLTSSGYRETHAWLTAYAPANNPEIIVTVLVEAGGEGSDVAAPVVKKVLKAWFED